MIFDIFKDRKKPSNVVPFPTWKDVDPPPMPEVKPPALKADAYYTVGMNEHGYTVFKIGSCTLTMNNEAVIALIEDLAHAIRRKYDVEITEIGSTED